MRLFPVWCLAVGSLLTVFWFLDAWQIRKELPAVARLPERRFEVHGVRNIMLLLLVVASLFLPMVIREIVMLLAIVISIRVTPPAIRARNDFTYHPIIEVAILFAGIFVTMIPVQALLRASGSISGGASPAAVFWMAGGLSSFLDNAPTYLIFFESARTASGSLAALLAGGAGGVLVAVSLGCVMMGANTYIGNGPNLMVKAICEDEGVTMPSFFGYMVWVVLVLVPLYAVITWWMWLRIA